MLFSFDIDRKSEGYTEFTTDVNTTFFNANFLDAYVVYATSPSEWSSETLDSNMATVGSKVEEKLL